MTTSEIFLHCSLGKNLPLCGVVVGQCWFGDAEADRGAGRVWVVWVKFQCGNKLSRADGSGVLLYHSETMRFSCCFLINFIPIH